MWSRRPAQTTSWLGQMPSSPRHAVSSTRTRFVRCIPAIATGPVWRWIPSYVGRSCRPIRREAISDAEIEAESERGSGDPEAACRDGSRHGADPRGEAEAWRLAIEDDDSVPMIQRAAIVGFARTVRDESLPLRGALLLDIPRRLGPAYERAGRRTCWFADFRTGRRPSAPTPCARLTNSSTSNAAPVASRRLVSEGRADVMRALAARAARQRSRPS